MNFFEAQKSAKRNTIILVVWFIFAVACLLLLANIIGAVLSYYFIYFRLSFSIDELATIYTVPKIAVVSISIIIFIALGSFYKLFQLRGGGSAIAMQLGGTIIPRSTQDRHHKKILNVVEEMAIASGSVVPQVFILNESGINAFAAGWKTNNAVIGITQGAVERLSRSELQGVIAHEFSHIFNGDMRLNIRLIAILHGILMVGLLGRFILRSIRFVGGSKKSKGGGQAVVVILVAGVSLLVVGYVGVFVGGLIKANISRQREYLADASAVQFTRDNLGLANALKKIGGAINGSILQTANATEYSHAYFSEATSHLISFFSFSTHPPLPKRITRLQANWDGKFISEKPKAKPKKEDKDELSEQQRKQKLIKDMMTGMGAGMNAGMSFGQALNAINDIGDVKQPQVDAAQLWHQSLPEKVKQFSEDPFGAQAIILTLLLDSAKQKIQLKVIGQKLGQNVVQTIEQLQPLIKPLQKNQAVPLIELVMPSLREMNLAQYRAFETCAQKLMVTDKKIDLREWVMQRMVLQQLQQGLNLRKRALGRYFLLGSAKSAIEIVLSLLSYLEHKSQAEAQQAFNSAKQAIGAGALQIKAKESVTLTELNQAVDQLERLKPLLKKRFLQACVHCIALDKKVSVPAYEVTRAIAVCLDSPMPPVLVNQLKS